MDALAEQSFEAWRAAVRRLLSAAADLPAESRRRLEELAERLEDREVTVTVGGHFKAGKSTILNAALGRALLPVSDLPETGTICVIQAGRSDSARVRDARGEKLIACSTDAIRAFTSLVDEQGARREQPAAIDSLSIALKDAPIPENVRWIDSPGINDAAAMDDCARRAAGQADVLAWVINSTQPLAEDEIAFLADYLQERGPHGVIFIINAFLGLEDTLEKWNAFLERNARRIRIRLEERREEMGFPPEHPPESIVVCGRAAGDTTHDAFGGVELRRMLGALNTAAHPRVRGARLWRAWRTLEAVGAELERELERLAEADRVWLEDWGEALEAARQRREEFITLARQAAEAFHKMLGVHAPNCANAVAARVDGTGLLRDETYGRELTDSLRRAAEAEAGKLISTTFHAALTTRQRPLTEEGERDLRELLATPPAPVLVACNEVPGQEAMGKLLESTRDAGNKVARWVGSVVQSVRAPAPPPAAQGYPCYQSACGTPANGTPQSARTVPPPLPGAGPAGPPPLTPETGATPPPLSGDAPAGPPPLLPVAPTAPPPLTPAIPSTPPPLMPPPLPADSAAAPGAPPADPPRNGGAEWTSSGKAFYGRAAGKIAGTFDKDAQDTIQNVHLATCAVLHEMDRRKEAIVNFILEACLETLAETPPEAPHAPARRRLEHLRAALGEQAEWARQAGGNAS